MYSALHACSINTEHRQPIWPTATYLASSRRNAIIGLAYYTNRRLKVSLPKTYADTKRNKHAALAFLTKKEIWSDEQIRHALGHRAL
jgi:hypothetical protein